MSNYSKTTDFEAKDSLPTGDSGKIIRGAEFETEFDAISTAIATKADTAGPTFTGTLTFQTISDGTIGVTAFVDEDDMSSDSATLVPTQQSVKAYVDSQVTAQDLDFQADSGGALSIDLDSETMTFTGGTGITTAGSGNDVEFAIDSTVATLTGSQTLISKTLTSPVLNGSVTGTAVLDEDNMASNSATKLATQQSIKAYVDTTVAATNELVEDSTPQLGGTLDLNGNNITGTGNINNTGTVTTDGLTVEGSSGSTLNNVNFLNTSTAYAATANRLGLGTTNSVGANYTYIEANNDVADGRPSLNFYTGDTATKRLRITDGGDVEFYEDGGSTAKLTWDASDEDLKFADNAKATFGAGNDLQIYHTGSHSFIQDTGVGDLYLATNGDKIILRNTTLGESFFEGTSNGDAKIFYNGLEKLATTSTGIDVTGTVTADALTVQTAQGDITIPTSTSSLNFARAGSNYIRATDAAGSFTFITGANDFATQRMKLVSNGDISFYEDTGTTAKFHWDASAESLGLGTSSPASQLEVSNAASAVLRLSTSDTSVADNQEIGALEYSQADASGAGAGVKASIRAKADNDTAAQTYLAFHTSDSSTNDVERVRIDNAGNVGIGTDSPASPLTVMADSVSTVPAAGADSSHFAVGKNDQYGTMIGTLGSGDGYIQQQRFDGTATTYDLLVQPNGGNVGIGTDSPAKELHLASAQPDFRMQDTDGTDQYAEFTESNGSLFIGSRNGASNGQILFRGLGGGSSNEFMRLDSSGRLLINKTSNTALLALEVQAPTGFNVGSGFYSSQSQSFIEFQDSNTTANYKVRIGSEGDEFIAVAGGSERMRIDSDGKVGIGTSSPASVLHLFNSSTASSSLSEGLTLSSNAGSENDRLPAITWDYGTTGTPTFAAVDASRSSGTGGNLLFHTATTGGTLTEAMRIDSDGNVGIGEDNPVEELHISGSVPKIQIQDSDGTNQYGQFYHSSGITAIQARNGNTDGIIAFQRYDGTTTDESARIDSSGNLLVGKTSASSSTDGAELKDGDGVSAIIGTSNQSNAASGNVMILNRRTTDGEIVDFRKNGSSVGSIGAAGSRVYISGPSASLHSGLIFTDNGSEGIIAPSTNAGAVANGTTDLGYSGGRFKNGHFSGNINANTFTAIDGVYIGGTGFANKLDDYEEGTWTPVVADATSGGNVATTATAVGRYTKVGRVVTVDCYINNVTTTGLTAGLGVFVRDLPFIAQGATYAVGSVETSNVAFTGTVVARVDNSSTYARLMDVASGVSSSSVIVSDLTSGSADIIFTATYMAI